MGTANLILGDCLERMKDLPSGSVDLICTDPPYGLEFMGKEWDGFGDNEKFQQFNKAWATEALRVLKPGSFMFAMGGTRTHHRLTCGIEDAGFMIRDELCWVYMCLSADTEVLTEDGWERYNKTNSIKNKRILIYDYENDNYQWEIPSRWNEYQVKDTLVKIASDKTEQLLTKGHRVAIEQDGKILFQFAETLPQRIPVPYLECLPNMRKDISDLCGMEKERQTGRDVLLGQLQTDSGNSQNSREDESEGNMGRQMDINSQTESKRANDGREELGMEGRDNLLQNPRQLCGSEIHKMSDGVYCDGSEGRLCYGASDIGCEGIRQTAFKDGSGASFRPRPDEQLSGKPYVVCQQQRPQTTRTRKSYQTTMAEVSREYYEGIVFCPTVSTGCFVARRNGKIFLTGNSGFPKAQDLGMLIEKKLGGEGEIIGEANGTGYTAMGKYRVEQGYREHIVYENEQGKVKQPTLPLAKEWQGWKTPALKPAFEPIVVAQKPVEGSITENVMKNGMGGYNIDECRIPYESKADLQNGRVGFEKGDSSEFGWEGGQYGMIEKGRYPSNLLMQEECFGKLSKFFLIPKASSGEKNDNLDDLPLGEPPASARSKPAEGRQNALGNPRANFHPTVKPVALMQHLIKLTTKPLYTVLDPFLGSGTTAVAALQLNRNVIGIEISPEYMAIAKARIAEEVKQTRLF